jgi:hypothetical protein
VLRKIVVAEAKGRVRVTAFPGYADARAELEKELNSDGTGCR